MSVVSLHGGDVPQTAQPRQTVITALEELLERAKAGEVQAVGYAALHADGLTSWCWSGIVGGSHGLIGAAAMLTDAAVRHTRGGE